MTSTRTPVRSVLYVPGDKDRALSKIAALDADAVILDLEDAVAPDAKDRAREALRDFARSDARPKDCPLAIRINGLDTRWGTEDLLMARGARVDLVVVPKVSTPRDLHLVEDALAETDAPETLRLWAMVETARGVSGIEALAADAARPGSRLAGFVVGTNDLVLETGIEPGPDRAMLVPHMARIVMAAKAQGLVCLDGVSNRFDDEAAFMDECAQARAMGFDGKTLIHPRQIAWCHNAFRPDDAAIARAQAIVAAFALPENAEKGAIALNGEMVERLHLEAARKTLAKAGLSV